MRALTAIFLCFSLTLPFLGTYTCLKMEKRKVKRAIKARMIEGMNKSELVLLKFTEEDAANELEWEHAHEFEYNGQMYDVVEKQQQGDTTYYYCWWDHAETRLNKQLSELVANAMGQNPLNKDKQERLNNFLKSLYYSEKSGKNLPAQTSREISSNNIDSTYSTIFFSPPAPPPEIA